jgi:murein L,D-transpeptidase YcbB/YkuD
MLKRAMAIDAAAAQESVSWGLGQVMGAHWAWLGYASVEAMVAEARKSVAGQARLMALYIEKAGLAEALRTHDWEAFARGYNGPGYKKYAYDEKIASAYDRYAGKPGAKPAVLRRGSRGEAVLALQRDLAALGYKLDADGAYGPGTAEAVKRFQAEHGLEADGIAGPRTLAVVATSIEPKGAADRWWTRMLAWLKRMFRFG